MNLKHGTIIKCNIDSNQSMIREEHNGTINIQSAAISIDHELVFICQNEVNSGSQGRDLKNKLGYYKAWYTRHGEDDDYKEFGVSDIEIISEPNANLERMK